MKVGGIITKCPMVIVQSEGFKKTDALSDLARQSVTIGNDRRGHMVWNETLTV